MMDYSPTLAAACGVDPGSTLPLDGKNLWPSISDGSVQRREDLFFMVETGRVVRPAVHHGECKLVREEPSGDKPENCLFHVEEDPA